ncbi:ferrochelatase [Antricoccus suffuscus]|uniref:Coproporphyrin III ferrochelatase n=1 Tax=Antricoccus suffuscus TaxID=1629062 RepID=A0A2T1A5Z6_9ACTN|nr:ferrochelatase [Antricoccus suffuscus]PRZ43758.1 ferrochelatase [Antricoccus suffuscus]
MNNAPLLQDAPIDALLVLSFGGPEGVDDVVPFLENVTRGRGIPAERLREVGKHYFHFDGISPINELNRSIIDRLKREFVRRGIELPIYWGNRNWHPMLEQTVAEMTADGVRRALVFGTSAYGGYSACRQYHEDIARGRAAVGDDAPDLEKLPQLYANEMFVAANVAAVEAAYAKLQGADFASGTRLVFTAHSIPETADAEAGPEGHLYSEQLRFVAAQVADRVGAAQWDLVWQSRSGPPHIPWLEPDICDHLETLASDGIRSVIVAPIGFVSDHLEVVWDLDTEAAAKAIELGLGFVRAGTAGSDDRFITMIADLIERRLGISDNVQELCPFLQGATGVGVNGTVCAPGCCGAQRSD